MTIVHIAAFSYIDSKSVRLQPLMDAFQFKAYGIYQIRNVNTRYNSQWRSQVKGKGGGGWKTPKKESLGGRSPPRKRLKWDEAPQEREFRGTEPP